MVKKRHCTVHVLGLMVLAALGACASLSAQGLASEFPSVSGEYSVRATGWNAQLFYGGPLNAKNGCRGYGSRGETEVFWEYFKDQSLTEMAKRVREHQLPSWVALPQWDNGRVEKVPAAKGVAAHLIIHRTNGDVPELVYLFEEGAGVLCVHALKPAWSKQELPALVMEFYNVAHGNLFLSDKTLQRQSIRCADEAPPFPATFRVSVLALEKLMTSSELERLKKLDGVYELVEPMDKVPTGGTLWGPEIAGRWGLVDGGSPLARELDAAGAHDLEDQEAAVILGLQRKLLGKDFRLKAVLKELFHPAN